MIERPDAAAIVKALGGRWHGYSASCRCPAHDDDNPSLSVTMNNGAVLVHCHAGCAQEAVIDALKARGLWPDGEHGRGNGASPAARPKRRAKAAKRRKPGTTVYEYRDATHVLRFEVVREDGPDGGKRIFQRRVNADGTTTPNMRGVELIPYKLPEVLEGIAAGETVFVVEGEGKVGLLMRWGLVATCNPMGAGKWRPEFAEHFKARRVPVVILPDNDKKGHLHAHQVAESLAPWAESVKVVALPRLGLGEDVVDWAERGGTKEMLLAFAGATLEWDAAAPVPHTDESDHQRATSDAGRDGEPAGTRPEEAAATAQPQPELEPAAEPEVEENRAPPFSVEALALDFAAKHAADLRYVAEWKRWFRWRGSRWAIDSILWAFRMARVICRAAAARADDKAVKMRLTDGKTEAAVERLAKADPRLAAEVDQWESDPWLLNME